MIKPTQPESVAKIEYKVTGMLYAFLLLVMALTQLVNFEAFAELIIAQGLVGRDGAVALAVVLLALEIFSLPFLLRMWLSRLARFFSAACVLLVAAAWLTISLQATVAGHVFANIGMFGDFLNVSTSTALAVSLALTLLSIWTFSTLGGVKAIRLK